MTGATLDPVLLGHNPFIGVDHLSAQAGREKAARFERIDAVGDVMRAAHLAGIRAMMLSTHQRAGAIVDRIVADEVLGPTWRLYPLVPYVQKYVRQANEQGLLEMATRLLGNGSLGETVGLLVRGGRGMLSRDLQQAVEVLVDLELRPFRKARLGAVFLHDAVTDLALGLEAGHALALFRDYVERRFGVRAGFATKNLPLLRAMLSAQGWNDALVLASINALGFGVNPSLEACLEAVRAPGLTVVAMNTLAGGALAPARAFEFLRDVPALRSVVIGLSTPHQATETVEVLRRHLPWLGAPREAADA